jgi:hypothetical protein
MDQIRESELHPFFSVYYVYLVRSSAQQARHPHTATVPVRIKRDGVRIADWPSPPSLGDALFRIPVLLSLSSGRLPTSLECVQQGPKAVAETGRLVSTKERSAYRLVN